MLEKIMDLINGQVRQAVDNEPGIPEEKKQETVNVASSSIMDSLKGLMTPENISAVTSLFKGGDDARTGSQQSEVESGIKSNLISNLTSKIGLDSGVAQKIAMSVIPAILSKFTGSAGNGNSGGLDIGSLISGFAGNKNTDSGDKSDVMSMLGGILGKN